MRQPRDLGQVYWDMNILAALFIVICAGLLGIMNRWLFITLAQCAELAVCAELQFMPGALLVFPMAACAIYGGTRPSRLSSNRYPPEWTGPRSPSNPPRFF